MGNNIQKVPLALPWYETEEDFNAITAILPIEEVDTSVSYSVFVLRISQFQEELTKKGGTSYRTTIKPSAFVDWCNSTQRPFNREAIQDYCLVKLGGIMSQAGG